MSVQRSLRSYLGHDSAGAGDRQLTGSSIDVLVAGGGMAGAFAAIGAAEAGASVLVVEPGNVLGGQGTAGGVAGFCGDTARVNAPFAELVATLLQHGFIAASERAADRRAYDLEQCAYYLQELVLATGARVLFHGRLVDAHRREARITSVGIAAGSQRLEYSPRFVVDATGACAVAVAAGLETFHEGALAQLPMSLYFTLWDTGRPVSPVLPPGCPTWNGDDDLPMTTLHTFPSGKVEVKMKVIGFDAADPHSLSAAEVEARRQMMGLIYHLQTRGYRGEVLDRHDLASVSRQIGVREARRVVGEYVLTEHDVTHAATFDDAVAVGTYHLDFHWPDRVERAGTGITTMVEPYHIPLRSLVPKGMANLLVPGRGLSGDQMAMSSYRVMATCAQTGYAAGCAAALCLAEGTDLAGIDIPRLQEVLRERGQNLDLASYGDYLGARRQEHQA